MQKVFIPNVFNYIMNNSRNLNFSAAPFYLYKLYEVDPLTGEKTNRTDWDKSIYLNMSLTNMNVTEWSYERNAAETGIMLVESI
jgi:hypothetical protein